MHAGFALSTVDAISSLHRLLRYVHFLCLVDKNKQEILSHATGKTHIGMLLKLALITV